MDAIETINYKGYKINIYQDDDPLDPAEWADGSGFLVHYHRDCKIENRYVTREEISDWYNGDNSLEKKYWIFPVSSYIHSGVVLSLGSGRNFPDQRWDVSHVGAVLIKRDRKLRKEKARKWAEGIVEEWNQYLWGEIYGYMIEDEEGEEEGGCWGFYGNYNDSGLISEAKAEVDNMIIQDQEKQEKQTNNLQPIEVY